MSLNGETTDPIGELRGILFESMSDQCVECIDARMLVGQIVKIVNSGEFELCDGIDNFSGFMSECTDGVKMTGTCGTKRKVCSHPDSDLISSDASAFFRK